MAREKQIEFPREQTHARSLELGLLGLSVLCIVLTVVLVLALDDGAFIGPW